MFIVVSDGHATLDDLLDILLGHLGDQFILEVLQNGCFDAIQVLQKGAGIADNKHPDIAMGLYKLEFLVNLLDFLLLLLVA